MKSGTNMAKHTESAFHDLVGFANELHVTILDSVVNHLHVVARSSVANPIAARLDSFLGFPIVHLRSVSCDLVLNLLVIGNSASLCSTKNIDLRSDALEDWFDVCPSFFVATGHERRSETSSLFSPRDAGADEKDSFALTLLHASFCVFVLRVTSVDDDVPTLQQREKLFDKIIDG